MVTDTGSDGALRSSGTLRAPRERGRTVGTVDERLPPDGPGDGTPGSERRGGGTERGIDT